MHGKLSALKNIIWAFSIVVCLAALFVGFVIAAVSPYDGSGQIPAPGTATPVPGLDVVQPLAGNGALNSLGETADGGESYLDSLTFLCDSAMIGLRDYGLLGAQQVWGSSAGNLPASSIAQCVIRYPGDQSEMGAAGAAAIARPSVLVISLGTDSLAEMTEESFTAAYTSLLNAIHFASPGTKLVCCSLTAGTADYSGHDGLTPALVSDANGWIRQICTDTGVLYADVASAVCDSSNVLMAEYASSNGKTLNSTGLNKVLEYLKTHMA